MNSGFVDRLKLIMEHFELSPSSFADKIGVQRSSISHLLNGRNRPSLDFVMKLLQTFPEVNIYWLLNGKGTFPSTAIENSSEVVHENVDSGKESMPNAFASKDIDKIIILYQDGSFEHFHPKK